ncbi:Protein nud1 [Lecanicillium sp. MT-2017a]|nr:Protein nud1 [Lecanicillium sp. MT-2017a]
MEHAWLDSLSEDWVSQPGSDASDGQLPVSNDVVEPSQQPDRPSRIPRRPGGKAFQSPANSSNILNERSANEINISRSRLPSKLAKEVKLETKDSRVVSTATCGSVVHNKAPENLSPGKAQTPEWKRRLVHGDLQYGEQRDLFCSAATGLQDMFKPPEVAVGPQQDSNSLLDQTMPSSPPPYQYGTDEDIDRLLDLAEQEEADFPEQITPSPSPRRAKRQVNYRATSDEDFNSPPHEMSDITEESPLQFLRADANRGNARRTSSGPVPLRQASGQTDMHEDFSPILIGRQNANDGKVNFGLLDMPVEQLHEKLERLQHSQYTDMHEDREQSFGITMDRTSVTDGAEQFKNNALQINLRRGGRSGDGSFYTRALSPELGVDTSEMLPEESLQASTPKEFPTVRTQIDSRAPPFSPHSPSMPRAPYPSPDKHELQSKGSVKTSGSPLKLFGPYDTFTNQTLLRRISQYEDVNSGNSSQRTNSGPKEVQVLPNSEAPPRRSVSQFGGGDLDHFEFTGDLSDASRAFNGTDKENVSPEAPVPVGSRRHLSIGNNSRILVSRRRDRSETSNGAVPAPDHADGSLADGGDDTSIFTAARRNSIDTKRTRASPVKNPTPKRRRTLHRSDVAFGRDEDTSAVDSAHQNMQLGLGKRKDARPGDFELADPDVLALRRILQPVSPASSRRSSQQYREDASEIRNVKPRESPRRQAKNSESHGKTTTADGDGVRKPSIRTQDFVDQAAQIMAMIRSQVKPTGLSSLEESEAELKPSDTHAPASESHQDSTYEPFSRPPSREGKQMPNHQERSNDPELEHRLQKYRELSDMGEVVSSSMRSVSIAQDAIRAAQELERQMEQRNILRYTEPLSAHGEVISDLPNVQITACENKTHQPGSPSRDYPSHSSTRSHGSSVPTGSSRGSDSRRTIMPESVSHLIPDRVGSMYLDKNQKTWVKQKEHLTSQEDEQTRLDSSEDDPFADIPDLTVDMTAELKNLKRRGDVEESPPSNGASEPLSNQSSYPSRRGYITLSPDAKIPADMNAAARDEIGKLDSRTTSGSTAHADTKYGTNNNTITSAMSTARRRNMTISFSSPIASVIQDVAAEDIDSLEDDDGSHESLEDSDASPELSPVHAFGGKPALRNAGISGARPPTRQVSQNGPEFIRRPVSRIDEQDEESTVEVQADIDEQDNYLAEQSMVSRNNDSRHASLSFIISRTPGHNAVALAGDESALLGQNVGKLSLSPLSEFTVNQGDQSFGFEVSYVMERRHISTGDGSRRVMSVTIRDLVDKLSEVEPYEPFWEDIDELDLSDKRLSSLHMLDEFCGRIVTLDASQNMLGHLEGVPSSVRQLKASHNMLTELTSWDHLMNLQYVDISGNEVKSLSALKNLVHLRSLKADNNKLTSLDGLDAHDGLLSLRARQNLIEDVDFSDLMYSRLTELDLDGNCLETVRNLEQLPALTKLKLSNNKLKQFELGDDIRTLRHLDLSGNKLTTVDVSRLPSLQTLHADGNFISEVSGLQRAKRLDSLSLREQRGKRPLDLGFLTSGYEVRKLYLSGNLLETFEPHVDMLNLQLLELANCGLSSLPKNLGQLMPNLRGLNINFNAIADLSPLRYIPRVKKLLVAGNRLRDSTSVTELLMDFPHLTRLDVRDNPMTLGFYASLQALVPVNGTGEAASPFCLPDADEERDRQYASRLDEPTKLRRRLHQVVLAASCRRLRMLDGLPIRRKNVLAMDSLLQALVEEGLVPSLAPDEDGKMARPWSQDGVGRSEVAPDAVEAEAEEDEGAGEEPQSSRWNAEDSFA